MNDIFSGLENLGFDDLKNLKVYDEAKKQESVQNKVKQVSQEDFLFDKQVSCPVCGTSFKTPTYKVNGPRKKGQDTDLFIHYDVVNPYFYDVWVCNSCGYAAMKADFPKIKSFQKDIILSSITPKWKGREYPNVIDEKLAIEKYKLALVNAIYIQAKNSTKAMICLKIAWMHRMLNDKENELSFLSQALKGFNDAYSTEDFPIYGMQRYTVMFLIGELSRRTKNYDDAMRWFSQVITTPGVPEKVKNLCRDCRDLIREELSDSQK
ncbi:DUF2225 domain-containing protein [Clostridium sp. 'White wine YQ']|uniref:DUF2225 domain-containing protein n=1 Tax=Clostridium sp. 'White wine YQ' TaxID=3027474 RepID=UPI0023667B3B|nr:DUF2225 domain-containing protein [Clostridium sp. 'White wine YQ']MDD7794954.1 DUF2225 domain-containing protein [Clostridium sp. 'White wine YQ']